MKTHVRGGVKIGGKKGSIFNGNLHRILERCEIGKLGLKGDKSRILKLTTMTDAQKSILEMFNCKYLGTNNHLKSIESRGCGTDFKIDAVR